MQNKLKIVLFSYFYHRVQFSRPSVQPNSGFMDQLNLYQRLISHNQTTDSIVQRWYKLQKLARSMPKCKLFKYLACDLNKILNTIYVI